MADSREIIITLKTTGGEGSTPGTPETPKVPGEKSKGSGGGKEPTSPEQMQEAFAANLAKSALESALTVTADIIEYHWDLSLSLTDNYRGERNKQIATTVISKVASSATSIASGAISGFAAGGPWGAVAGAAIATVKEAVTTLTGALKAQNNEKIQLRANDAALDFTRQRAGWSVNAASIGEDL